MSVPSCGFWGRWASVLVLWAADCSALYTTKGLGLDDDDQARISKELEGGHAAVGVLTASDEAAAVSDYLAKLGGASETHEAPDEALDHAASQPTS